MQKLVTLIALFVISFAVSSCNHTPDGKLSLQPYSLDLTPPPGPPEYQKGWSEGCESGSNAYAYPFYKMTHAFDYKFDATLRNNKIYYQVWKDAFLYCAFYWERMNQPEL